MGSSSSRSRRVRVHLRLDERLMNMVKEVAECNRTTITSVVEAAIGLFLAEEEKRAAPVDAEQV